MSEKSKKKKPIDEKKKDSTKKLSKVKNQKKSGTKKTPKSKKSKPLPKNFTKEPQNSEHMDLNNFSDDAIDKIINVYRPVSDDTGAILGNVELEIKVIDCTERLKAVDLKDEKAVKEIVDESLNTIKAYDNQIHLTSSVVGGILTKYRIREGEFCNAVKPAVKAAGENFTEWVGINFSPKRLRSLEDFMRLARIPGIIKYAFLDLERLKDIARAIKGYDSKDQDPIGTFFKNNDITLDFDSDEGMEDFKTDLDTAIAARKIENALEKDSLEATVDKTLVKNVVGVCKIGAGKVSNIVSTVRRGEDLDNYLKELHRNKGRMKKVVTENDTIEGFPRIVSELKSTVEYITDHTDLVEEITEEHVAELERQIAALRSLISPQNTNNQ